MVPSVASASQLLVVVALGGNALLPRGAAPTAEHQHRSARAAARALAPVAARTRLVVTHGNGPQVGLLALKEDAFGDGSAYPLDVLDAESAGQIGYIVELELDNAIPGRHTVAVITRVRVDPGDPAFADPTKFIGAGYEEAEAQALAAKHGWTVKRDGERWRRVVASPEPQEIVQLTAIRTLVEGGFVVVCVGGGGVPVVGPDDAEVGIEAVIDKDLSSALLAIGLGAEVFVLATDVDAVYEGWGTEAQRAIGATTPEQLRAGNFPAGSMGPKVEAVCRFVEATGHRAAIGKLSDIEGLVAGTSGTQIQ